VGRQRQWALAATAAATIAAPLAERAVAAAWRLATDEDPPRDPAGPDVDWTRALVWTAASAVAVALVQLAARRGAALAWERATGGPPPRPRRKGRRGVARAVRRA
jgi:NADPH:quinone reductase-like Zn-dependent oxidoreductase